MFRDRIDAGIRLTQAISHFQDRDNTVVIGLPRGGVPVAYEVSQALKLPLDIVCPRKIGAPMNKEFAIGAITETGEGVFDEDTIARLHISKDYIAKEVAIEKSKALHRLDIYRKGKPARNLEGKTIILIDDGLATGATMKAAIRSVRAEGAKKVVVAIPVSPPDTLEEMKTLADEVICLLTPRYFQAVGQFYENFEPTEDEEVIDLMNLSKTDNS
jgi:putative phosphoribosyl transferase